MQSQKQEQHLMQLRAIHDMTFKLGRATSQCVKICQHRPYTLYNAGAHLHMAHLRSMLNQYAVRRDASASSLYIGTSEPGIGGSQTEPGCVDVEGPTLLRHAFNAAPAAIVHQVCKCTACAHSCAHGLYEPALPCVHCQRQRAQAAIRSATCNTRAAACLCGCSGQARGMTVAIYFHRA